MMMMMGEGVGRHHSPGGGLLHAPPWAMFDDPAAADGGASCYGGLPVSGVTVTPYEAALAALQRYLPAAANEEASFDDSDEGELSDPPVDAYSCDEFRMYEFKVRRCARGRSHDWTECPYAHPGEKARRRDPRRYHYSGTACPDFRKGACKRGDACEFAHGVFECWLHPARYRTQPCKDGTACRRRVCFFAHTPEQLRVLPQHQQQQQSPRGSGNSPAVVLDSYDGSPLRRHALEAYFPKSLLLSSSSPTTTLISPPVSPPSESPPVSPNGVSMRRAAGVNEAMASLRQLQLSKVTPMPSAAASWGVTLGGGWGGGGGGGVIGLPRGSGFRAGFCSLPTTPTGATAVEGYGEEEEPMVRVESGRALRAKMFERLSKESGLEAGTPPPPDVGWVTELVK